MFDRRRQMSIPDLQPTLQGNLLWLRPLRDEDFNSLFAVASDPLIWELHPEKNRFQRHVFEKFFRAAIESRGALAAVDTQTSQIIGTSRFNAFDQAQRTVEVGYTFLARRCWGRGYNREMKALMLDHAFKFVDQVLFYIGENNHRSRRAVEKIGAQQLEKVKRRPQEGAEYFAVVYGINKVEYLNRSLIGGPEKREIKIVEY
ncbi:MAG TPA: GNAT family N-acetyltransferase, partial [Bdellovibrionales bacterium]|nr:GNAT family N-acetyltransferase [Bdellovibrionales bacterium]